jgi:hypothetical protein
MVEPTNLSHNNFNNAQKCKKKTQEHQKFSYFKGNWHHITVNRMQIPHKSGQFSSIFVKHYTILFFKIYLLAIMTRVH